MKTKELLKYIKENPKASQKKVIGAGFAGVLKKHHGNSINKARSAAGVPIVKSFRKNYKRKLSEEDEECLILLYNCKAGMPELAKEFNVNKGTVQNILLRAKTDGKHIIGDPKERFDYAIKTYYSYKKLPQLKKRNKRVMKMLEEQIISPLIRNAMYITVKDIIKQTEPYERLLNKVFSLQPKTDKVYGTPQLLSELETILKKDPSRFYFKESKKKIISKIKRKPVKRIRIERGQYCFIPFSDKEKKGFEQIVEEILSPMEKRIIYLRYGLEDGQLRTLEQIGEIFLLSKEKIRQIEREAIKKLRHASESRLLRRYLKLGRMKMLERQAEKISQLNVKTSKFLDEDISPKEINRTLLEKAFTEKLKLN